MNNSVFERQHLESLRSEGYFVSIFGPGKIPDTLIMDCKIYLTDSDEHGGATRPLCVWPEEPIIWEGKCTGCKASLLEDGVGSRPFKRGSVVCPLCNGWTEPWSIQVRHYRGVFKIIPGQPAEYIKDGGCDMAGVTHLIHSQHQINAIAFALSHMEAPPAMTPSAYWSMLKESTSDQ